MRREKHSRSRASLTFARILKTTFFVEFFFSILRRRNGEKKTWRGDKGSEVRKTFKIFSFSWSSSFSWAGWWPLYVWVHDAMHSICCCARMPTCLRKLCADLETLARCQWCSSTGRGRHSWTLRSIDGTSYCYAYHDSWSEPGMRRRKKCFCLLALRSCYRWTFTLSVGSSSTSFWGSSITTKSSMVSPFLRAADARRWKL